jgi:hypothetical protein
VQVYEAFANYSNTRVVVTKLELPDGTFCELGVGPGSALLDRKEAARIHKALGYFLEETPSDEPPPDGVSEPAFQQLLN